MPLHLFRDGDTDVFAMTLDRSGDNLPCTQESNWAHLETLGPIEFAWGEHNFNEVYGALRVAGFYLLERELHAVPPAVIERHLKRRERRSWWD